jgi:hypothetical protein
MNQKRHPASDPPISTGRVEWGADELKKEMNEIDLKKNPLDMVASS